MFFSFSKTIARFGGFRLGLGIRITKKNAVWIALLTMFVAMFQLMWYSILLCGWLVYAMFYGIYWCIKKAIGSSSKNKKHKEPTNEKTSAERSSEKMNNNSVITPSPQNDQNKNENNHSSIKVSSIIRWIVGGHIACFILATGFHFSSLFLIASAFLMFPLPFMNSFYRRKNIKTVIVIILSVILLLFALFTSPSDSLDDPSIETTIEETTPEATELSSDTESPTEESTVTENVTETVPETTVAPPEDTVKETETKVRMVWVSSNGEKYHSKSSCSNMSSPRQIPLDEAKRQGYTACKKCH